MSSEPIVSKKLTRWYKWTWSAWGVKIGVHYIAFWFCLFFSLPLRPIYSDSYELMRRGLILNKERKEKGKGKGKKELRGWGAGCDPCILCGDTEAANKSILSSYPMPSSVQNGWCTKAQFELSKTCLLSWLQALPCSIPTFLKRLCTFLPICFNHLTSKPLSALCPIWCSAIHHLAHLSLSLSFSSSS